MPGRDINSGALPVKETAVPEGHELLDEDELHLARLGYSQELQRSWSGFNNFAISFSIISILAGCFTSFGLGWNNGGPAAIAWGWPILSAFILLIGLCMSELVSAFPTSGGIYWWAAKLGGPKAGYYTGWLNLIGLIAILASVAYGSATFLDLTLGTLSESWLAGYSLKRVFVMFLIILVAVATINIFSSHLLAVINNISVWWHVAGATAVIGSRTIRNQEQIILANKLQGSELTTDYYPLRLVGPKIGSKSFIGQIVKIQMLPK